MKCLFVDIASHEGFVACADGHTIVASQSCDHRVRDDELLSIIRHVLGVAGWKYADLTALACTIGPGGFTSLRMAAACVNVLASQLQLPSVGIHLSDLLRARVTEEHFLWLHSTKRAELFVRGFGEYASRWPEPTHILLADFLAQVPHGAVWAGELLPEHADALSACALRAAAPEDLAKIPPEFLQGLSYKKQLLFPWYGRKP